MRNYLFLFILFIFLLPLSIDLRSNEELYLLENAVSCDLVVLNIPPKPWVISPENLESEERLDVAIIGGGMAGQTAALALIKEGIVKIKIFDENLYGKEGPWERYARMPHLRSGKSLMGPALDIPNLTCRSWYEALYGVDAWNKLKAIPTKVWSDYLHWYGRVLNLPIQNERILKKIQPQENGFELTFVAPMGEAKVYARKIVLATGREGFGGKFLPSYLSQIPKQFYRHTNEQLDPGSLKGRKIVIIGAGASAFDSAAYAIENGALKVDLLMRRSSFATNSKFALFSFPGMMHGFYGLSDEMKSKLVAEAFICGIPPSQESIERIKDHKNFEIHVNSAVRQIELVKDKILLETPFKKIYADFIIAGTGFDVNGWRRPELQTHMEAILLWDSKLSATDKERVPILKAFPYLGKHFEFLEKEKGMAPYLKSIYCFNYGAFLSHGLISGDIQGISVGASRLAKGIATDFFLEDIQHYAEFLFTN